MSSYKKGMLKAIPYLVVLSALTLAIITNSFSARPNYCTGGAQYCWDDEDGTYYKNNITRK